MKTFYFLIALMLAGGAGQRLDAQCMIPGYTYLGNFNGHTYYQSDDYTTWTVARANAEALGGQLVVIDNVAENAFVEAATAGAFIWIGLTDEASEGAFTWVNGDLLTYSNWYPGEPDNGGGATDADFALMTFSGQWEDYPAFASYPYILELAEGDCPCPGTADADCDGVNDDCDQCPGGDDSGPCAAATFPGFAGIPADWICSAGEQKVFMCHMGKTICVSENAIQAHLNHGDFLGPCTGCVEPRSAGLEETPDLLVLPNPATNKVEVRRMGMGEPATLRLIDQMGHLVHQASLPAHAEHIDLSLEAYPSGLYYVQVSSTKETMIRRLMIVK
jgi:hypothetical protein